MKPPISPVPGGDSSPPPAELSKVLAKLKTLNELLCANVWEDGSAKGRRILMLFIDDTSVQLLLKLERLCLKGSVMARTLDDTLELAEKALNANQVVWQQDVPFEPSRRGRGKKSS